MAGEFNLKDYRKRMDGAMLSLKSEFGGLRTGRANASYSIILPFRPMALTCL